MGMTVDQLRKSLLQFAIEGKLVRQDPNDEPASVLLERVRAEKARIIKEGKVKKDKEESIIFKGADNRYYLKQRQKANLIGNGLPAGWSFAVQSEICWLGNGYEEARGSYPNLDARYLRTKANPTALNAGQFIKKGSRVILVDGENSGEVFTTFCDGYLGSTFKPLECSSNINFSYLLVLFKARQETYRNNKTGAAIPHLNKQIFKNSIVAVPPLAEQARIEIGSAHV